MVIAGALAAWPPVVADGIARRGEVTIGAIAVALLVAGLARGWAVLVPAAIAGLGAEYAVHLLVDDRPIERASALYAAGLLVVAELSYWSFERRIRIAEEPGATARRVAFVALLAGGTLAVGAFLLGVSQVGRDGGLGVELVGVLAAVATLAIVLALVERRARSSRP